MKITFKEETEYIKYMIFFYVTPCTSEPKLGIQYIV